MTLSLKKPIQDAVVSLHTEMQSKFLLDEQRRARMKAAFAYKWYDLEKQGEDFSCPAPVHFEWEEAALGLSGGLFYLLVSENECLENPWVYITDAPFYDVFNLKCGTKYFWCVQKNGKRSSVESFFTAPTAPRCIKIDGVSNVRDIGGYKVAGGRIRQGMVYRGGEMELHMQLCKDGCDELRRLGIRTDLDMRAEAADKIDYTTAEALGVKRIFVPSMPYADVFDKKYTRDLKNFYRVFADRRNYPIYFHCWGGADRTGTFAFILGAFLGMSLADILNDYEFTSLSIWGLRSRNHDGFAGFLKLFMELPGDTLCEKAVFYLRDYAKLSEKQLALIYDVLVEKGKVGENL